MPDQHHYFVSADAKWLIVFHFSLDCSFSSRHPSDSPLPSLCLLLLPLCVSLSPCSTHLCTINLSSNELELLTLSLLLSTAAVPYLCSIFLPLFLTQPLCCCSIDRHVISYMNNASSRTKIVSLPPSFAWDLFYGGFVRMHLGWFLFSSDSYFVIRDLDVKISGKQSRIRSEIHWREVQIYSTSRRTNVSDNVQSSLTTMFPSEAKIKFHFPAVFADVPSLDVHQSISASIGHLSKLFEKQWALPWKAPNDLGLKQIINFVDSNCSIYGRLSAQ